MLASFYIEESIERDTGVASYRVAFPAHVNEYGIAGSKLVGSGDTVWLAILDLMSKVEALNDGDFPIVDFAPELFIMPEFKHEPTDDFASTFNEIYSENLLSMYNGEGLIGSDVQAHELNTQRAMNKDRL